MILTGALDDLDAAVLEAHARGDGVALANLYGEAADAFDRAEERDTACFYYTQAYVFALEAADPAALRYATVLASFGRL